MTLLYCINKQQMNKPDRTDFTIVEFTPSLFRGFFLKGEKKNIKTGLVRCYFQLMTLGKAKLFYAVNKDNRIMHSSYVVPRCFKFPYLGKDDYTIGPCFTNSDFRGQGIYPQVLRHIVCEKGNENTVFYMSVAKSNIPSIKGIEKAGFKHCGSIKKTRFLKRYITIIPNEA